MIPEQNLIYELKWISSRRDDVFVLRVKISHEREIATKWKKSKSKELESILFHNWNNFAYIH